MCYYYFFYPSTQFPGSEKNDAMQYRKVQKSSWNEPYYSSSFIIIIIIIIIITIIGYKARTKHGHYLVVERRRRSGLGSARVGRRPHRAAAPGPRRVGR